CATKPVNTTAQLKTSPIVSTTRAHIDVDKIDRNIARLESQIGELEYLEAQIFKATSKSRQTELKRQLEEKMNVFGNFEVLQANIRVLEEIKLESETTVAGQNDIKLSKNKN